MTSLWLTLRLTQLVLGETGKRLLREESEWVGAMGECEGQPPPHRKMLFHVASGPASLGAVLEP